jgi:hypothetical protein
MKNKQVSRCAGGTDGVGAAVIFKNLLRRVSLMCGLSFGNININIIWVIILLIIIFGNKDLGLGCGACSDTCSVC